MPRTRSISTSLLGLSGVTVLAVAALAACGDDDDSGSTAATSGDQGATTATVAVEQTDLGDILVDGQDRTLYLFLKDSGTTSECNDDCAAAWPPLTVDGTPTAGSGADGSLVGTTSRSDGTSQVTYNGHPVYRYSGDQSAGDTAGEGVDAFGAAWYVVSPAGDQITGTGTGSGSSSGGNGY